MFVNTEIDDGSQIASLMSCFTKKMVNNPSFPKVSERVTELKTTEGGQNAVCAVMETYEKKAREEGMAKGLEKGMAKGLEKGEDRMSRLVAALISKNRFQDIEEMTRSVEYRNKLYAEFGIA